MVENFVTANVPSSPLLGKVALVTGGARRIGAAIVKELHEAGMNVVVHYQQSVRSAKSLAKQLNSVRPDSIHLVTGNIVNVCETVRIVKDAESRWGRLDLLVNNASSFYATPLGDIDEAAWEDLLGTNLKAPLFLAQAASELLRERGGAIVNLTDIHADRPLTKHPVYCAAKAGLVMLTQSLARDLAPEVRVNSIAPGVILWPGSANSENEGDMLSTIPLDRQGDPKDIAQAVLFLVRDAPYVTGQNIAVDGGRSLGLR